MQPTLSGWSAAQLKQYKPPRLTPSSTGFGDRPYFSVISLYSTSQCFMASGQPNVLPTLM